MNKKDDIGCDLRFQPRRLNRTVELVISNIPGGGVVRKDDFKTTSTEMKEGALLGVDQDGIYHLTKTAEIYHAAASGATDITVSKNHEFKTGDIITNTSKTAISRAIAAVTNSDISWDTITLEDPLGVALSPDDVLIQASASEASGSEASFKYSPVAVATNPVNLLANNTGCGLMVRGDVKESLMPYPVDGTLKDLLPLIRFV